MRNLCLFAVLCCLLAYASAQQCSRFLDDDPRLGDRGTETTDGLIAGAFSRRDGQAPTPTVNVFDARVVCFGVGRTRNTFRSVSVVANYSCTSNAHPECSGAWSISQFEFSCSAIDDMWTATGTGVITSPADAGLESSLRTDCVICAGNDTGIAFATVPDDNHCVACPETCSNEGLAQCITFNECCNFYDNDTCVENCTLPARPNSENNCEVFCDPLPEIDNGFRAAISDGNNVGSVISYGCDPGYNLVGVASRTCTLSNTTTFWSDTETTCEFVDCGNLTAPANGEVSFTSTTLSSVAQYSCDEQGGYGFMGGAQTSRTCQTNGEWSGSEPSCVCSVEDFELEDGDCVQRLGTGAVVGIVVGCITAVLLIVVTVVLLTLWIVRASSKSKAYSIDNEPPPDPLPVYEEVCLPERLQAKTNIAYGEVTQGTAGSIQVEANAAYGPATQGPAENIALKDNTAYGTGKQAVPTESIQVEANAAYGPARQGPAESIELKDNTAYVPVVQ